MVRLHAFDPAELGFARDMATLDSGYRVGRAEDLPRDVFEFGFPS